MSRPANPMLGDFDFGQPLDRPAMNDPHVVAIHYDLEFAGSVDFTPPAHEIRFSVGDFEFVLSQQHLKLEPRAHFADAETAVLAASHLLAAWEIESALHLGIAWVRFKRRSVSVVDRMPTPGSVTGYGNMMLALTMSGSATVRTVIADYPPQPDLEFSPTEEVRGLHGRFAAYLDGREPLQAMAYYCLTVIQLGERREIAAGRLNTDATVLSKIGELSSTRGDGLSARKFEGASRPLTQPEVHWLRKAIPRLIIQYGKSIAGPPAARLTMSELPPL